MGLCNLARVAAAQASRAHDLGGQAHRARVGRRMASVAALAGVGGLASSERAMVGAVGVGTRLVA